MLLLFDIFVSNLFLFVCNELEYNIFVYDKDLICGISFKFYFLSRFYSLKLFVFRLYCKLLVVWFGMGSINGIFLVIVDYFKVFNV